jgi:hypothetical protein
MGTMNRKITDDFKREVILTCQYSGDVGAVTGFGIKGLTKADI